MRAVAVPRRDSGNLEETTSPTGEVPPNTHGPLAGLVSEDRLILAHPDLASFCSVSADMARRTLSHIGPDGSARMVDVGAKPATHRVAVICRLSGSELLALRDRLLEGVTP